MLASTTTPYRDRASAGQCLAKELACYTGLENLIVLGLPRGGLVVAGEISRALMVPLDVMVVRRIYVGQRAPATLGTMASGGVCVLNQEAMSTPQKDPFDLADAVVRVREEVLAYERFYRGERAPLALKDQNVILVDDGASSGRSLRAAIAAARTMSVASVSVAVPVASPEAARVLGSEADEFICPFRPQPFYSVGLAYERFPDVADDALKDQLDQVEHDTQAQQLNTVESMSFQL